MALYKNHVPDERKTLRSSAKTLAFQAKPFFTRWMSGVRVPHRPPFAMLRISTFSSLSALSHALVPTFCPHLAQSPVPPNRLHALHRLGPSRTGRRRHPMSSPHSCAPAYTAMDATVWRQRLHSGAVSTTGTPPSSTHGTRHAPATSSSAAAAHASTRPNNKKTPFFQPCGWEKGYIQVLRQGRHSLYLVNRVSAE